MEPNSFIERHALLTSKLRCPAISDNSLQRPSLIEKLNEGLKKSITLVTAPAGFGKTTLIAQWFQAQQGPKGWLALDELDNDFPRFMSYAYALMQKGKLPAQLPSIFNDWARLTPANSEQLIAFFCQSIALYRTRPIIVFDDFHLLTDPQLLDCIERILHHFENRAHFVFIARCQSPLNLNTLYIKDQVQLISHQDLKFTQIETRSFFSSVTDARFKKYAPQLNDFSGWPAGLQLFRIAQENNLSLSQQNSMLGDYIMNEIIQQMPPPILAIALQASVSRRFNQALLDFLSPARKLHDIIEALESRYALITVTGSDDRWYRFHSLFRQALIRHFKRTDLEAYEATEQRCAQWWLKQAYYSEAAEHLIHTDDQNEIAKFVLTHGWSFYRKGQYRILAKCFEQLSQEIIAQHPTLTLTFAWFSLIQENPAQADRCIHFSESMQNLPPSDLASYHAVKAAIAVIYDDFYAAESWGDHALTQLESPRPWEHCYAFLSIAEARINQCDFAGARCALEAANQICQSEKYITLQIQILYLQSEIHVSMAQWAPARQALDTALEFAREKGLSNLLSIDHLQRSYARVLRLQGELIQCQQVLSRINISQRALGEYWEFPILIERMYGLLMAGSQQEKYLAGLCEKIHRMANHSDFSVKWQLPADRALILYWAKTNNQKQLNYLIQRYEPLSFDTPRFSLNARLNLGLALMASKNFAQAVHTLRECSESAALVHYTELQVMCRVAIKIASGISQSVDEGSTPKPKLENDKCVQLLTKVLTQLFKQEPLATSQATLPKLTKTESKVNGLLEKGLSNRTISEILSIKVSTVRSHIKSINKKNRKIKENSEAFENLA